MIKIPMASQYTLTAAPTKIYSVSGSAPINENIITGLDLNLFVVGTAASAGKLMITDSTGTIIYFELFFIFAIGNNVIPVLSKSGQELFFATDIYASLNQLTNISAASLCANIQGSGAMA